MKKILAAAASLILLVVSAKSQSEKKEPPPPPPKPKQEVKYTIVKEEKPPVVIVKGKEADNFYKRNPTVSGISRQGNVIAIKKKDGTTEKYDTNKKEEIKSFTEKYGVSPIPPPPPPPKVVTEKKLS